MNRIKELRLNNNKTQKDIADYVGLTKQAISAYESGFRNPKPKNWKALADYFNVSIAYLKGATTYEVLGLSEKGLYSYVIEAMDRAFDDYIIVPEAKERVLKAIAYSIDDGEVN